MKKILIIPSALFLLVTTACNNSTDTSTTKDSTSKDVKTSTTIERGDTASYERMPQKTTDSIPR